MTQTGTETDHLTLIEQSKTELEALEAGMHGQTPEARATQNAAWNAQHETHIELISAALRAGVSALAITAITHRENW
jgi:hypothetical protein